MPYSFLAIIRLSFLSPFPQNSFSLLHFSSVDSLLLKYLLEPHRPLFGPVCDSSAWFAISFSKNSINHLAHLGPQAL